MLLDDMPDYIPEYGFTKIADAAIQILRASFNIGKATLFRQKESKFINPITYDLNTQRVIDAIHFNINKSTNWSNEIEATPLLGSESRNLNEVYVNLDIYASPLRSRVEVGDNIPRMSGKTILNKIDKHIVLYGGPGAGKTTFIKKIFQQFGNKNSISKQFTCPIVIRFRELNYPRNGSQGRFGLLEILFQVFNLTLSNLSALMNEEAISRDVLERVQNTDPEFAVIKDPTQKKDAISDKRNKERALLRDKLEASIDDFRYSAEMALTLFLDECRLLIFLEGFDEIPDINVKDQVELDLANLTTALNNTKIIITSRNGELNSSLPKSRAFEICSLTEQQISIFVKKWLRDTRSQEDFIQKIKGSPVYDTAIRPLTLAHLCAIYEKRGDVPSRSRYTYKIVIDLLVESWDQARSIKGRATRSVSFSKLDLDSVKVFLNQLAYELTVNFQKSIFTDDDLIQCYKRIHLRHDLPEGQALEAVRELESRNGLFIKSGFNSFEFAHKSLQEYMTAVFIKGYGEFPKKEIIGSHPNEFAIIVAMSSDPNKDLQFLLKYLRGFNQSYWPSFSSRLLLERPDFTEDFGGLLFFFTLQDYFNTKGSLENSNKIADIIRQLFKQTNINVCLTDFFTHYSMQFYNPDKRTVKAIITREPSGDIREFPREIIFESDLLADTNHMTGIENLKPFRE